MRNIRVWETIPFILPSSTTGKCSILCFIMIDKIVFKFVLELIVIGFLVITWSTVLWGISVEFLTLIMSPSVIIPINFSFSSTIKRDPTPFLTIKMSADAIFSETGTFSNLSAEFSQPFYSFWSNSQSLLNFNFLF